MDINLRGGTWRVDYYSKGIMMKLSRITPRGVVVLIAMLGLYGLLTACLILAAYYKQDRETAMLVASGATSISVPVAGLLALFIALWNRADADLGGADGRVDDALRAASTRWDGIVIDRSIVVIGGGHSDVRMEIDTDGMRVRTGAGPSGFGPPVDPARALAGDGCVAIGDVTAPRELG